MQVSVVVAHRLNSCSSWALVHWLNSCGAWAALLRGMWDHPRWNLRLLHWPADSLSLSHQGSPALCLSCGTWDPRCVMQDLSLHCIDFWVVACRLSSCRGLSCSDACGIEHASPALQDRFSITEPPGKSLFFFHFLLWNISYADCIAPTIYICVFYIKPCKMSIFAQIWQIRWQFHDLTYYKLFNELV